MRTVGDRALEASRVIRMAAKKPVEDFVAESLVELDSLAAAGMTLVLPVTAPPFRYDSVAASFAIALIGSGSWSLYKMECDNCRGFLCQGNTCVAVE